MKTRLTTVVLLVALMAMAMAPISAGAAPKSATAQAAVTLPITGTATNALGQVVNFAGDFNLNRVVYQNGALSAVGTLTGTLTNTVTGATQAVNQLVTLPITQATGSCQILHLELGPLDLNLLGLMVHLDKVVLDITAQSGPGNLLGNLLCAVAHLLDGNASSNAIANLFNRLLGLLG